MSTWKNALVPALTLCLGLFLVGCPAGDDDDSSGADLSWETDIQPILADQCAACHEGDAIGSGGKGWLNSHAEVTATATANVCGGSSVADCIPGRIEDGSMPASGSCPPGDSGCITEDDFATLEDWVAAGAPE